MVEKVTREDIEAEIAQVTFMNLGEMCSFKGHGHDDNYVTTICNLRLKNGFTVRGESACVDPANYNKALGEKLAYEDAINNLWPLMGFALKDRLYRNNQSRQKEIKEASVLIAAQTAHEINRQFQLYNQEINPSVPWELATDAIKQSAISGMRAILSEPNLTSEELHDKWYQHKLEQGYTYGIKKDDELKTHPCMLPYWELPEDQRFKDRLFKTVAKCLLIK